MMQLISMSVSELAPDDSGGVSATVSVVFVDDNGNKVASEHSGYFTSVVSLHASGFLRAELSVRPDPRYIPPVSAAAR